MAITNYSHAYLVGALNAHIKPQQLNEKWEKVNNYEEYAWLCSMYYQGHVDAMLDVNKYRPEFLKDVCHYKLSKHSDENDNIGKLISLTGMKKNLGKEEFIYKFRLLNLHLYFFPLGIVLFAIEIDDSGTDLDDLTAAHNSMMSTATYKRKELTSALSPILELLPSNDASQILGIGNKYKIYQVIKIETEKIEDTLLYEIGTSSPIGCIGTNHQLAPSKTYYDNIMNNNVVSAFSDWKGLAIMDSFTMISNAAKSDDWTWDRHFYLWNNCYFQLIYLRCLFEKSFCSIRNTNYRMTESSLNISEEITNMERYYFYEKISYNFLPNLLYKSISIGLELKEEREELSKQVKERAKEEEEYKKDKEEKRLNNVLAYVSIFAVFSVIWDICSIGMKAFTHFQNSVWFARVLIIIGIAISLFFILLIKHKQHDKRIRKKKSDLRLINISPSVYSHIASHFQPDLPGSKFYIGTPEELLEKAMDLYPEKFSEAVAAEDGRIRISLTFPEDIGVSNVVSIDDLTDEEKNRIAIVERQGRNVRAVKTNRIIPTKECQIILSKDWHLITMFPGELAPPLPESPDVHDEYWDNHVFIDPISE